jgi:hypothetical protein
MSETTNEQDYLRSDRSETGSEESAPIQAIGDPTDPFVAMPPKFKMPRLVWISVAVLPFLSFSLVFVCMGIDILFGSPYGVNQLIYTLIYPDVNPAHPKKIITPILLLLSVGYGIVLSVIGIVLDLAASKFAGSVAALVARDKKVLAIIASVTLTNIFGFLVFMSAGDPLLYSPRFSVTLLVVVVIGFLFGTFPFMAYLFFFLDPQSVVTKIVLNGLQGVLLSAEDSDGLHVEIYQARAITSVEHLVQVANKGVKKVPKNRPTKIITGYSRKIKMLRPKQLMRFVHFPCIMAAVKRACFFIGILFHLGFAKVPTF